VGPPPGARPATGPTSHNDTWIAACCLTDNLPLATLNTKDFADFAEHDGLTLI
jgi:predicted nucleic acid-binding protein